MKHTKNVKILQIRCTVCIWCVCFAIDVKDHILRQPTLQNQISCRCTRPADIFDTADTELPNPVDMYVSNDTIMYCDWDWRCRRIFGNNLSDSLFWFVSAIVLCFVLSIIDHHRGRRRRRQQISSMNFNVYSTNNECELVCVVKKCPVISWQIDGEATWIENIMRDHT